MVSVLIDNPRVAALDFGCWIATASAKSGPLAGGIWRPTFPATPTRVRGADAGGSVKEKKGMKRLAVALCSAALSALPLLAAIQEPIKVEGGLVSGTPGWAWGVRAYLGIPFAAPPVGNRRWRPPQAVIPWQGVRAAREFSAACMQSEAGWTDEQLADPGLWHKSEDCLYLNVWTPATSADERLPVLVWIHAGAGTMGSTARPIYDGNALAKKGVVVVSANYRLGVFGWFAHPELTRESEHRSSGNYGALDQLAALQWVKKNIAQFGGDPKKVTVFGQSAGCAAVNWLAASPLAKGLFRGGIGQSFRTFRRMITLAEAENAGAQFAKAIGKPSVAALRAMPAQALLEASGKTPAATATNTAIVDGWFLPQDIYTIYSQGKQNDIPLITGEPTTRARLGAWVRKPQGPQTPSPPTRNGSSRSSAPERTLSSEPIRRKPTERPREPITTSTATSISPCIAPGPSSRQRRENRRSTSTNSVTSLRTPSRTASIPWPRRGRCTPPMSVTSSIPCA